MVLLLHLPWFSLVIMMSTFLLINGHRFGAWPEESCDPSDMTPMHKMPPQNSSVSPSPCQFKEVVQDKIGPQITGKILHKQKFQNPKSAYNFDYYSYY